MMTVPIAIYSMPRYGNNIPFRGHFFWKEPIQHIDAAF